MSAIYCNHVSVCFFVVATVVVSVEKYSVVLCTCSHVCEYICACLGMCVHVRAHVCVCTYIQCTS